MKKLLKFLTGITPWQSIIKGEANSRKVSRNFIPPNLTNFHSITEKMTWNFNLYINKLGETIKM
jgi:hypothetical protein